MEFDLKHGTGYLDDQDAWVLDGWWWWSQVSTRRKGTDVARSRIYVVGRPTTVEAAIRSGLAEIASVFPMHRLILGMVRYADDKRDVDHVNGNGLDNRRENLRIPTKTEKTSRTSRSQNLANSDSRGGTSAFKGVSYCRKTDRWKAQITVDGHNRNLGRYDTQEQAALAYNLAATDAWGKYAKLNVVASTVALPTGARGSSHFRGVTWDKSRQLWIAQIAVGGKHRHLGRFETEEEAALAYNAAALEELGERARLNVV